MWRLYTRAEGSDSLLELCIHSSPVVAVCYNSAARPLRAHTLGVAMASCPSDSEDEDQQLSEEDEEVEDEEVDFDLAAGNDDKLIEIAQ